MKFPSRNEPFGTWVNPSYERVTTNQMGVMVLVYELLRVDRKDIFLEKVWNR